MKLFAPRHGSSRRSLLTVPDSNPIKIKNKKNKKSNLLSDDTSVIDLGSPYVGLKFPNILRPTKPVASRLTEAERLP